MVDPTEKTNSPYVEQKGFSFARGDRRKVNTLSPFLSSLATMKVQHALSAVLRQTSASNQQGIPAWSRVVGTTVGSYHKATSFELGGSLRTASIPSLTMIGPETLEAAVHISN